MNIQLFINLILEKLSKLEVKLNGELYVQCDIGDSKVKSVICNDDGSITFVCEDILIK